MKTRMILAALLVCGAVVAMQAPASAALITKTYLVGDKDDFNDVDDNATYGLVTGDPPLPGTGPGEMDLSELVVGDAGAGSTDRVLKPLQTWPLFMIPDFEFAVDAAPSAPISGILRVATWDVDYSSAGTWADQPVNVSAPGGNGTCPTGLTAIQPRFTIRVDEMALDAAALAATGAAGGEVHITIGTLATLASTDEAVFDFAELELQYRSGAGVVPEAPSAAILCSGLAGLLARRRRRS